MSTAQRIADLGIVLPAPTIALGSYVPAREIRGLIFCAGHLGKRDGEVVTGALGLNLDIDAGHALARSVALDLISSAAYAAGDVDRLRGVAKLTGFIRCAEGFRDQPKVLNGASDLLLELFGEAGRHARSAVGVSELPLGAALEIEAIFEVE